jgi:replicative DNA helicase
MRTSEQEIHRVTLDKVPPQNIDAERAVLGAILMPNGSNVAFAKAEGKLGGGNVFYREAHQKIFEAMQNVNERGEAIDLLIVVQELERLGNLEKVGGVPYLDEMQDSVPTAENIEYYAEMVLEEAARRVLIYQTAAAYNEAFDNTTELDETMFKLEEAMIGIRRSQGLGQVEPIKRYMKETFTEVQRVFESKELVTGLTTGFPDLDRLTCGFHKGEYIILAARSGVGKSTFARNIGQHVGIKLKIPVLIFSIETSSFMLVQKFLASESTVNYNKFRTGYFTDTDWPRITISAGDLSAAPIYIDDKADLTPSHIRAKCQMFLAEREAALIIIDHLHDVYPDEPMSRREEELRKISRSFKTLARSLNVPVLTLCQLNRGPDERSNRRPMLHDLRGSGSLEQNADVVLFLYRDDYYPDDPNSRPRASEHTAELIVAKQRHGDTGTIYLVYKRNDDRYYQRARQERRIERDPGSDDL